MKKIYLAIPYSGNEELSFNTANHVSVMLMKMGYIVFSPISHTHPMCNTPAGELPGDWEFWKQFDESFIKDWADELWVLVLDFEKQGFSLVNKSKGVNGELEIAKEYGKPIKAYYLTNEDNHLVNCDTQFFEHFKINKIFI